MDLQIKKGKLTYRFVRNFVKICALFLLLSNNSVFADEVKSFTSREEQSKCAKRFTVTSFPLQRGRFVIAGKITDEKGNLLQDVCVKVSKSSSGMWKSKEVRNTYTLSDYFVIYLSGCDSIYIELFKDGYINAIFLKQCFVFRLDFWRQQYEHGFRNGYRDTNVIF